jgi:predicted phosphodiesterase
MIKNNQNKWTKEQLLDLYRFKHKENKTLKEMAVLLGKSEKSIDLKYKRVDWESFTEDPDGYLSGGNSARKWTQIEMAQLYAFMESQKSYAFIAEQLNRSYISVERKAQDTNWQAWKAAVGDPDSIKDKTKDQENNEKNKEVMCEQLASSLVILARHDKSRIKDITEEEFLRKINFDDSTLPVYFKDIKQAASDQLDALGFGNPDQLELKQGTYVIVGDSHGKFTKTEMFNLLKEVNNYLKPTNIIHVGHLLDDDNDISYHWGLFKNLIVVAKIEELKLVQEQRNKFDFKYDVVRGGIMLGDELLVMNQDFISDYVKTSISSLDSQIFDERIIVNNHRLELIPKCSSGEYPEYFASPGCLCEPHIVSTIKQIDFEDNKTIKQAFSGSFVKYRRMHSMKKYWTQGILVVHVDESGAHTIVPCVIKKVGNLFATSYFDKIITSSGIKEPSKKIFVVADTHAPNQDNGVLDIHEQIAKDYKPDVLVNVGDANDYRTLNHHEMEKGIKIRDDFLDESAQVYSVLRRMSTWAKEKHIIFGNHERFAKDFVAKFPQFEKYLDFNFVCGIDELGYKLTSLKEILRIGDAKFIHGDLTFFGQQGDKLEKSSRTYGDSVFVGHVHYQAIRFGAFGVGLGGKLDQGYNEPTASRWIHGFGLCNQYMGKSFPTTLAIVKDKCIINNKQYIPLDKKSWNVKSYTARIVYDIK